MKHTPIKVKLSKFEIDSLLFVAMNGYGDGEFFVDSKGNDTGYGGKKSESAYIRAIEKLQAGVNLIENTDSELLEENESLKAINKQLLEALQHAVDLFKELHPPDGVHDCKFYESLIAKSKL